MQNAHGVAKRTRVYDTKKLAKKLIASTKYNQSKQPAFNTLSVEELSEFSSNNMWKVNRQVLVHPKTTKSNSVSTGGFFAAPSNKVVLRRKDFAVDEHNKQGALHYLDLELGEDLISQASGMKTNQEIIPVNYQPQDLVKYMQAKNAKKDQKRRQRMAQ